MIRVIVTYVLNGATKTDVLVGSDVTVQRVGEGADVVFPHRDGYYEQSANLNAAASGRLDSVMYARCEKAIRQGAETDIRP